jgi:hypothetical protein
MTFVESEMKIQSTEKLLSPQQFDSLTNNLVEAMQILFKSVATREMSRRIKMGLEYKKMKNGEK